MLNKTQALAVLTGAICALVLIFIAYIMLFV